MRAQQLPDDRAETEIERGLREATRRKRDGFKGVHPCPASSGDVPDDRRLVIFGASALHKASDTNSAG